MEKLKQAYDRLDPSARDGLCAHLGLPDQSTKNRVLSALVSITGLNRVLSSLNDMELSVFRLLTAEENGLIFSDIEKNLKMKIPDIEEITQSLQNRLLIYVFKNRKHLNNRFDKAYIFPPFFSILTKTESDPATAIKRCAASLNETDASFKPKDRLGILQTVYSTGMIMTLSNLEKRFSGSEAKLNTALEELIDDGLVTVSFVLSYPFTTVIVLSGRTIRFFSDRESTADTTPHISNHFTLLIDILHSYDVIKSNGLFFTQQQRFRKTDLKKLHQKMIPLQDSDGSVLDEEDTLQLSLFCLDVLDCTHVTKSNIFVSLNPVRRHLHAPDKLIDILLKNSTKKVSDENFFSPVTVPQRNHMEFVLKLLKDQESAEMALVRAQFVYYFCGRHKFHGTDLDNMIQVLIQAFTDTVRFLLLAGVLNREKSVLRYSDDHRPGTVTKEAPPSIYINPDFSLIVPRNETPGRIQYIVLAFSTITKNDITINTHITKEAVLNAYKRGMKARIFTETLERYAKNNLPQNMTFLINEWIKQSLDLQIHYGTILEVNHQSFIDELEFKQPESIIRRLSDTCAIVSTERVDDIVKLGEKHKALIRIDLVT